MSQVQTQLLVIQASPFCNIDCGYCYLANRTDKRSLSYDDIREIFTKVVSAPSIGETLTVVWHAGEPLVLSPDYYETAFRIIDECVPEKLQIRHAFQTNGILLNDAWCELIKKRSISVGISIDGPQPFHDEWRRTRSGRGTFEQVLSGLKRLQAHQIPFHTISVLNEKSMRYPELFFKFIVENDIHNAAFNIQEIEGANTTTKYNLGSDEYASLYKSFLRSLLSLMREHRSFFQIREVEHAFHSILNHESQSIINDQSTPWAIITIDIDLNVYTFSPELAGNSSTDFGSFQIGNLRVDKMEDIYQKASATKLFEEIEAGIEMCKAECEYFPICRGGSPSNKYFENGSFASSKTTYCTLAIKAVMDVSLDLIEARRRSA